MLRPSQHPDVDAAPPPCAPGGPIVIARADLDLDAYLARIGYEGTVTPTLATLEALQAAHATHIPFENVDVIVGRPIRLDLGALQQKLVAGGRGGYCFEQNGLFRGVLERVGFPVTTLAARVRRDAAGRPAGMHAPLRVECEGRVWLCDVGYGAAGPLHPLEFTPGVVHEDGGFAYRIKTGAEWSLSWRSSEGWEELYTFGHEPQTPDDIAASNHFMATHPTSRFTRALTVQRPTIGARYVLRHRTLTTYTPTTKDAIVVADAEELLVRLRETFLLRLSVEDLFRSGGDRVDVSAP
jgi:N-hydroxyarylamine O-acetyltransferase